MTEETVILTDANDNPTGVMEKMDAHRRGLMHRAVSVCIFNKAGDWLLHRRAAGKYHSANLWTNACCSHPRPGENTSDAAHRRLQEEMGIDCELKPLFSFTYRAELDHDLVEHEFDHVFYGQSDDVPDPDPMEVSEWKYFSTDNLRSLMKEHPEHFTEWFKIIFPKVEENKMS